MAHRPAGQGAGLLGLGSGGRLEKSLVARGPRDAVPNDPRGEFFGVERDVFPVQGGEAAEQQIGSVGHDGAAAWRVLKVLAWLLRKFVIPNPVAGLRRTGVRDLLLGLE